MNIAIGVVAAVISVFLAFGFFKAGKFKATSSKEALLGAGFGWIEKIPFAAVRLIAWLEILGAIGIVLAPIGYFLGFEWAIWVAVTAAAGLALTMVGAIWVHGARCEAKFTLKMNLKLLVPAVIAAVLWAILPNF